MKIICKWIFKQSIDGVKTPQLRGKLRDISDLSGKELLDMIITLLAQEETIRLIIEEGEIKND